MRPLSDDAYKLMKEGQDQGAISLFSQHVLALNAKKDQFQNEKKMVELIEDNLRLSKTYLANLQKPQVPKDAVGQSFTPIAERKEDLDLELERYDPRAQGLLRRMVTYPLPHYTYQDCIGLDSQKDSKTIVFFKFSRFHDIEI